MKIVSVVLLLLAPLGAVGSVRGSLGSLSGGAQSDMFSLDRKLMGRGVTLDKLENVKEEATLLEDELDLLEAETSMVEAEDNEELWNDGSWKDGSPNGKLEQADKPEDSSGATKDDSDAQQTFSGTSRASAAELDVTAVITEEVVETDMPETEEPVVSEQEIIERADSVGLTPDEYAATQLTAEELQEAEDAGMTPLSYYMFRKGGRPKLPGDPTACLEPRTICFSNAIINPRACCEGVCTIDRTMKTSAKAADSADCQSLDDYNAKLDDRIVDLDIKEDLCYKLEAALDAHYVNIDNVLIGLPNPTTNATGLSLQIDMLCKNANPQDPGLRDLASYARFDYVTKCHQADVARCEYELAIATKEGLPLWRSVTDNGISYISVPPSSGDFKKIVTCDPIADEISPYALKPFPFYPLKLETTCGDAGYEYYVD